MTGLNLENFLHLLRADFGAWATLGLIALVLALMAWTSWGSRRALRKCLVLSVVAHFGLALYGGSMPVVLLALHPEDDGKDRQRIQQIKVTPSEPTEAGGSASRSADGRGGGRLAAWDKPLGGLALADAKLAGSMTAEAAGLAVRPGDRSDLKAEATDLETAPPAPANPEARAKVEPDTAPPAPGLTPGSEDDVAPAVVAGRDGPKPAVPDSRIKAGRGAVPEATPLPRTPAAVAHLPEAPSLLEPTTEPENAEQPNTTTAEPAPPAAAELGAKDVAQADVIPARPDSPRLSAGGANLRTRSRPGTGTGGAAPSGRRPSVAMALQPAAVPDGSAETPAVRPTAPSVVLEGPAAAEPGEGDVATAEVVKSPVEALPVVAAPESNVRRRSRPQPSGTDAVPADRRSAPAGLMALSRVTPTGVPALAEIQGATGGRPLADVPEVYRSRLDPNRSAVAFRAGASPASEQAVERALDWLARHQDIDGRWDGATAKYDDGTAVKGDDDYTVHCPEGELCFGECIYWEADTALTGLALLSYLGAGYTQTDGKYAETVGKGLDFLLLSQKPDGDLRGRSKAVGMYCHAMATIALCEAYALTGDERLKAPVGRAIGFLVRSRARDGLAWRYTPGASSGDTSILGWVVMALKSARELGISVPSDVQSGTIGWLAKVSSGEARGLGRYQPQDNVTPTMTAEAWVCRQFLGVGGPGPASTEAASYLLSHGPRADQYNLYYWYYGTLAMYQHGGEAWARWNAQVRDEIVRRQRVSGHPAGSWDPDDSPYGAKGGRIYCTALATLSLEVYYRYLRLYDDPKIPPTLAPNNMPRRGNPDPALGRKPTEPNR